MIETFLTAYDPSDLPGTSIDPLGFERGYLFLADKILPGLTNVASRPRYFALICAGIYLSSEKPDQTDRETFLNRRETILRMERLWALANVLARPDKSGAVRGVTYAQDYAKELQRGRATRTNGNYRLLSRQQQYGAIGMYANVADGLRFLNRDDFVLTPALGEVAAEAFVEETSIPAALRRAIVEDSDVSMSTLASWGERAHVDAPVRRREAACLREALHYHDVRSRMADLLRRHPPQSSDENELVRLARIEGGLKRSGTHADIREAIACILAYEACYQLALLAFERLLWLCKHHTGAHVTLAELSTDPVLQTVKEALPLQVRRCIDALNQASTLGARDNLDRLGDVRRFLEAVAGAVAEHSAFVEAIISRHTDVQHGKFDRGRRKMPWLERTDSRIALTMTRSGGMNREVIRPEHIVPHPYRLGAADALLAASREA